MAAALVSGCVLPDTPRAPPATAAAPPVAFDGTYHGTVQVTSSAMKGAQAVWCNTPPAVTLTVQKGTFSYVLAHPDVPSDSLYSMSPTFTVTLAPDGSFSTLSTNGESQLEGGIAGTHLSGQINGAGCGYAITADKS